VAARQWNQMRWESEQSWDCLLKELRNDAKPEV